MDAPVTSPHDNTGYEKMEEDLTCPVCLELYADPLMMPCSHSICKTCLNDIKTSREKTNKTEFECPTCRDSHPITADLLDKLPKNLALENIVFRFQEIKSTSLSKADALFDHIVGKPKSDDDDDTDDVFDETHGDSRCGMCDENQDKKAEWCCPQCDVLYCQSCLNTFHPQKGSLSRHKVCKAMGKKTGKESVLYCPSHSNERASIFCDTCKVTACHLCVCQGQGAHGHHDILDLNTAKEKIQATFTKATEDLFVLTSAFSLRDKEMDSQLETIKSLHESAQSQISSQFQCLMSDVTATLQLAKNKFQETILFSSSQKSLPIEAKSKQIKSALSRCSALLAKCDSLVSKVPNIDNRLNKMNPIYENVHHSRSRSLPQQFSSPETNFSLSSSDEGSASSVERSRGPENVFESRRSLSLLDQREAAQLPQPKILNKLQAEIKNQGELSKENNPVDLTMKKNTFSDDRALMKSAPVPRVERKTGKAVPAKYKSDESIVTSSNEMEGAANKKSKHTLIYDKSKKTGKDIVGQERNVEMENSELKVSPSGSREWKNKVVKKNDDFKMSVDGLEFASCEETMQDDWLLKQAAEIEQILEEIKQLSKRLDMVVGHEEDLMNEVTANLSSSLSSFSDLSVRLLSYLTTDTNWDMADIPIMMPSVRSVASPVSPGQKGMPRVQSRTLITWGFNSTSFTAEPVECRGQWMVNITRNTSHIGDVKTGYLFGVGVARQSLSSKEQVGMNVYSYGIVCSQGLLAFCHDSHMTPITPLTDLPLSIRLAVTSGNVGVTLSYCISLPGTTCTIQGRRVIALHRRNQPDDEGDGGCGDSCADGGRDDKDKSDVDSPMLPVFTVSQRVKMQFPLSSDES